MKKTKTEYEKLEEIFEKIPKIPEDEFGTPCPVFESLCASCKFWLLFNEYKNKIFRRFL